LTGLNLININTLLNNFTKGVSPLANHKSAIKRARQNELRRLRNKSVKTRIKTIVKDIRSSAVETSGADISAKINAAQSEIDRASKKGVIHKRTAARKISRLTKLANSASS
jgi:small subunit ribosomal protein S20